MIRIEGKSPPLVGWCVWLAVAAVFAADHLTPYGISIFTAYMVPMAVSFFFWRERMPMLVALAATCLIIVAYFTTPDGPGRELSEIRRSFTVITLWILAAIGYLFIRVRREARKEVWLQNGQAELAQRLVGHIDLAQLADNVTGFFADHLGAKAGVLYVEEKGGFVKTGAHAAVAGSAPERFLPGDGLLGQAAKDNKVMQLDDVPDGYLKIGSSLGEGLPRHLIIVPFSMGKEVNSVLELGFTKEIRNFEMELMERGANSVAVAVQAAKYRMQLQELLEETQMQSEEVQAQSEELRVSNEELEEQSRALRESQSRLELQQAELEEINNQLGEQTKILEQQKEGLASAKQDLEIKAREVEQASRYKSDFLANMSHELRTPLNSSLILAKLLGENRSGNLNEEQVKYANTIESAGKDLLHLINDVLDLSKIEAGHMEINPEAVSVKRTLSKLRDIFAPIAETKSLSLVIEADPSAPEHIQTDAQRLEQVLKNLLSNALKFTEDGSVKLTVNPAPGDKIAFAVSDTGIGIEEEKQRVIFDPFFQADGTTARKYGGTGLGLSISSNLARLLGGEIRMESEHGSGSVFTLTIPTEHKAGQREDLPAHPPSPAEDAPPEDSPPFSPQAILPDDRERLTGSDRVILAVEDDLNFAEIIMDLAHEMDFKCLVSTTAQEAMALSQQYLPSAIVLDVGLPDNSGLIVLERLKADSRTRHIPVHVVSAGDYAKNAFALGAVGYMLKPVKRDQLAEAFANLETRLTQTMRRVLVVEDDPVQIEAMSALLGSRDVDTVCAQSAAECLGFLRDTTFDCMVLDLSLPDASGFTLLETLSAEDSYSFPPVIVYTGRNLSPEEEQRLRRYSKSIIIKGAKSPERLLDEVTLFLHQVVSELPPEKQLMIEKSGNRDAALEGRRILIAEDDVRNIFALTSLLEGRGVNLVIARNGKEALMELEKSVADPQRRVDLVLMDVMMPEMDGLTAMREIRKRNEWRKLPIIALTAKAMRSDQEQCLSAGANDYLAKPLDVDKLLSLIRVWIPR